MENFSPSAARRNDGETRLPHSFCGVSGAAQHPLRACSACAGDYEDPDRTTWVAIVEDEDNLPQATALEEGSDERRNGEGTREERTEDEFPAQDV